MTKKNLPPDSVAAVLELELVMKASTYAPKNIVCYMREISYIVEYFPSSAFYRANAFKNLVIPPCTLY